MLLVYGKKLEFLENIILQLKNKLQRTFIKWISLTKLGMIIKNVEKQILIM